MSEKDRESTESESQREGQQSGSQQGDQITPDGKSGGQGQRGDEDELRSKGGEEERNVGG